MGQPWNHLHQYGEYTTDQQIFYRKEYYGIARKRYARLLPAYQEQERRREAKRVRPKGARHPQAGKKPRFGPCEACPAAGASGFLDDPFNRSWYA